MFEIVFAGLVFFGTAFGLGVALVLATERHPQGIWRPYNAARIMRKGDE